MAWFKVDDHLWSHPKFAALTDSAQALWLRAGSYSAEKLTDGVLDERIILTLLRGKPKVIEELISAGMWRRVDGGVEFHDWAKYQPSAESVRRDRDQARERMANVRANKGANVRANTPRSSDNPVPGPVPLTDVTNLPGSSTELNAPAIDDDPIEAVIRERRITNLDRIRRAFGDLIDPDWTSGEVLDLAAAVLDRSTEFVNSPEAYIEKAMSKSRFEIAVYATQVRARSPRKYPPHISPQLVAVIADREAASA